MQHATAETSQHARHGTARIRSIAGKLKDLRERAGMTTREAARKVDMSPATLNRLENGARAIDSEEISALLAIYGVTGTERERLLRLSREANTSGWWETGNGPLPNELTPLINFEAAATAITDMSMLLVPGLLQTPDYIRAVMSSGGVVGADAEARVAARIGRRSVLNKPRPPRYLAILDEAVVRRPVGGAQVMAEQLRHILDCARRPHLDVLVLPFRSGAHTGLDGSCLLLEFAKARPIVHLEHKRSSLYIDEPDDVAPFHAATDTLVSTALGPQDSLEFLASVVDDFSEG